MLTPLHRSSRIPVVKMERKREMKKRLAKVSISGMMNFPVRRQTTGRVQYARRGREVKG